MSERLELSVTESDRLDHFLRDALPHLSRRHLRRLIEQGNIRVNGRRASKGMRIVDGDVVSTDRAIAEATRLVAEPELALRVLYEDDALLAIDKPCGVPSVAQRTTDTGTVANFVLAHCPDNAAIGARDVEAGIVHRLDTPTSGVLVATKSQHAFENLRQQFRQHRIEKTYRLEVSGQVLANGVISAPLRRMSRRSGKVEVAEGNTPQARLAETEYRVIARTALTTHLEVLIRTGARHQIRAHLASIGHSIIGDTTYGTVDAAPRLMLHAWRIAVRHPVSDTAVTIEAPLPPELEV